MRRDAVGLEFQPVISAAGSVLEIEEVVDDGEAINVSELDVPDAVDVVVVVAVPPDWRVDRRLELVDGSSAGFDGSREGGKGGEKLKINFRISFSL